MKVFKHRNLMGLIYSVLLALPLCSILGRVLYVQCNKNAKDSYSGEITEYILTPIHSRNDLVINQTYYFTSTNYNDITGVDFSSSSYKIFCTNVIFNYIEPNHTILNNQNDIASFSQYKVLNDNAYYTAFNDSQGNTLATIYSSNYKFEFSFVFKSTNIINDYRFTDTAFYQKTVLNNNYFLDNAFSYSVNELIKDNNFGEVNFVGLFDDLFLDSSNQVNALYLHFANWYMNYVLFISIVYILFLVLMWFINFIRKMLEQGMDFGSRGY